MIIRSTPTDSWAARVYYYIPTDAENEKNEFYTRERLLEIVTQNQELHPREFIRSIINDIQSHIKSHELSDDLSMLTFIYGSEWNIKKS